MLVTAVPCVKMAPDDNVVETIKFLMTSIRKLSDRFVTSKRSLDGVITEVKTLRQRLEWLEQQLQEAAGDDESDGTGQRARWAVVDTQLPVVQGTAEFRVPVLNLPLEKIVEVYANNPILLEPFSRPCSLTARTLTGEIGTVELEVAVQGSTWVVESQPCGWLLIPRPGSLERKIILKSLDHLYAIEGVRLLPGLLHLIRPAQLDAVVVGQRWQLREKGLLSITPHPLRGNLSERLASLEQRLDQLESKQPE